MLPEIVYLEGYKYRKAPSVQLYRVPHDVERYNMDKDDYRYAGARVGVVRKVIRESGVARPEIYRVFPDHTTPIGEKHQWLWRNINPNLSGTRWRTLLGNRLAWTNSSGFPGRRDYVNRMDMDENLPNFDAARVNGGMILEGVEEGGIVWLKSLLTTDTVPTTEEMLNSRMWSWGTSVIPRDGSINMISRLGTDNKYYNVRIPFLTGRRVWLPLDELHKLEPGEFHKPTWIIGDPE